jgi:4-hydroxybenzoyl-CoA reductase subunit beta
MLRLHEYRYHRPGSLADALDLIRRPDALPIAGGTDLVPNMKHRLFSPNLLVALKQIPELQGITMLDQDGRPTPDHQKARELVVGAAETLRTVADHPFVQRHCPSLSHAAGLVAGPQIRNQGTIGGNLCLDTRCTYYNQSLFWREALGFCLKKDGTVCHVTRVGKKCVAAHSADTPPVLLTLSATVDLASADGNRSVPISGFFVADGIRNTVRRPDELVARVRVPIPPRGFRAGYQKLRQRNSIDFPLLSVACGLQLEGDRTVRSLSVVVSGLGARPRVITGLDRLVEGKDVDEAAELAAEQAHRQAHPLENMIVEAEWRRAMVPVYVRRAILACMK